jgi:SAM-dependent methyltransferase
MNLEYTACDLCGNTETDLVAKVADTEQTLSGEFAVVRCKKCDLQYLNPRPDKTSIGTFYPNGYYAHIGQQAITKPNSLRSKVRRIIRSSKLYSNIAWHIPYLKQATSDLPFNDDFIEWVRPGKMLEVGCGAGGILDYMSVNGWQTFGIEPSIQAASTAESKGHRIFRMGGDDDYPETLLEMRFDLIYLSHSLEHTHSPRKTLENLRELLEPGSGKLILEVPNIESVLTYFFGVETPIYDVPRHLYFFKPATLTELLDKTGFAVESMRTISRPQQFMKVLDTKSTSILLEDWKSKAEKIKSMPELIEVVNSMSRFSQRQNLGAALRVVARVR